MLLRAKKAPQKMPPDAGLVPTAFGCLSMKLSRATGSIFGKAKACIPVVLCARLGISLLCSRKLVEEDSTHYCKSHTVVLK